MDVGLGTDTDRRVGPDRRRSRLAFRYPDRRLGYPRRLLQQSPIRLGYLRFLAAYRDNAPLIVLTLIALLALNASDLVLTLHSLGRGATEANPAMAFLLEHTPALAVTVKLAVGVLVAGALWVLRRYRRALEASLLLMVILTALAAYHGTVLVALA